LENSLNICRTLLTFIHAIKKDKSKGNFVQLFNEISQ
jgi:hypothetical protein